MGEYIDRKIATRHSFRYRLSNGKFSPPVVFVSTLDAIHTVNVRPVRGKWEFVDCAPWYCRCNRCKCMMNNNALYNGNANYCPNCGADMREDKDGRDNA